MKKVLLIFILGFGLRAKANIHIHCERTVPLFGAKGPVSSVDIDFTGHDYGPGSMTLYLDIPSSYSIFVKSIRGNSHNTGFGQASDEVFEFNNYTNVAVIPKQTYLVLTNEKVIDFPNRWFKSSAIYTGAPKTTLRCMQPLHISSPKRT